jgi:hypothetical protein
MLIFRSHLQINICVGICIHRCRHMLTAGASDRPLRLRPECPSQPGPRTETLIRRWSLAGCSYGRHRPLGRMSLGTLFAQYEWLGCVTLVTMSTRAADARRALSESLLELGFVDPEAEGGGGGDDVFQGIVGSRVDRWYVRLCGYECDSATNIERRRHWHSRGSGGGSRCRRTSDRRCRGRCRRRLGGWPRGRSDAQIQALMKTRHAPTGPPSPPGLHPRQAETPSVAGRRHRHRRQDGRSLT